MTDVMVEPGSMLGVLGGGQLGAMFAAAARRLGYHIAVWDQDPDAPAHRQSDRSFTAAFSDLPTRENFSGLVRAVTFEWENVPADLCEWLEERHRVRPSSAVLRIIQDRVEQKQFLRSNDLPVVPFIAIAAPVQLAEAAKQIGLPALCKTATSGYDGKGQWPIRRNSDVDEVARTLQTIERPASRWILEQLVEFERELSVLVVRGANGECRTYPVVENHHECGILRMTLAPATVSLQVAARASDLARQAVDVLKGVGVFCVELFHTADDRLFINEIAPRPHNSGHYTLDACTVSQFEQQVRAVCGAPLGEVRQWSPAAMVNLIGAEMQAVTSGQPFKELLALPGAVLHLYGKKVARPGRKMGHVTFLGETREAAAEPAHRLLARLAALSAVPPA
ncbi:MAG: 5-(carboxyamino)imidazole ribonucleotide synthase [Nitrospira sp.]|nr:5-(carboxyamino)imidazole ribonucleotide synthase [Nitrospira sp.]